MSDALDSNGDSELTLACEQKLCRPGWLLVRGQIVYSDSRLRVCLRAELDSGQLHFDLPVSRRGDILEVIRLPSGVRRLVLQQVETDGPCRFVDFELSRCSAVIRLGLMAKRIFPVFLRLSSAQRRRIGLRWYTPFLSPSGAYALASNFVYHAPALEYDEWLARFDLLTKHDRHKILRKSEQLKRNAPALQVWVDVCGVVEQELLDRTLNSLQQQLYTHFTCLLVVDEGLAVMRDNMPSWIRVLERSELSGELEHDSWSILLTPGCYLSPHALYWFASESLRLPELGLIYSDHDEIDSLGRRMSPSFKPDWSLELAMSSAYPGHVLALRNSLLQQALAAGKAFESFALLLDVAGRVKPKAILHIPALLWHQDSQLAPLLPSAQTVEQYLAWQGVNARVEVQEREGLRVCYALPEPRPLVSLIVPTRDLLRYLQPCITSILSKTAYANYELIIVDNQSNDAETISFLYECEADPRVRVLRYDRPFNYAEINNYAVRKARGSLVCLLNNDTEVISPDWLDEMVSHITQADVGVVGAKLFYADGRVQHAGDVVGAGGEASHLHAYLDGDAPGYMGRAMLAQDLTAVTAACLLTWRDLYLSLGGLDEEHLAVAFNDVDYCLRARECGKRVIFTPYARLYHYESVSRGKEPDSAKRSRVKREKRYFRKRWCDVLLQDPFYNPNLSYVRPDFSLSHAPVQKRPW